MCTFRRKTVTLNSAEVNIFCIFHFPRFTHNNASSPFLHPHCHAQRHMLCWFIWKGGSNRIDSFAVVEVWTVPADRENRVFCCAFLSPHLYSRMLTLLNPDFLVIITLGVELIYYLCAIRIALPRAVSRLLFRLVCVWIGASQSVSNQPAPFVTMLYHHRLNNKWWSSCRI